MDLLARVTAEQEVRMRTARDQAVQQMHLPEDVAAAVRLGSEVSTVSAAAAAFTVSVVSAVSAAAASCTTIAHLPSPAHMVCASGFA